VNFEGGEGGGAQDRLLRGEGGVKRNSRDKKGVRNKSEHSKEGDMVSFNFLRKERSNGYE